MVEHQYGLNPVSLFNLGIYGVALIAVGDEGEDIEV